MVKVEISQPGMGKRTNSKAHKSPRKSPLFSLAKAVILIGFCVLAVAITMIAVTLPTDIRSRAACNDSGCQNVRNGSYWQITNCNVMGDPDGDQQLCDQAGRVGTCRGSNYCCPQSGAMWTTNMSACMASTPTPMPYTYGQSTYYAYGQSTYTMTYAYGQSAYYTYGQSTYYTYGQSTYYTYGQSTYYGYGQSTYTTTYAYGQSAYYTYGQSTYLAFYSYAQSSYTASYAYGQLSYSTGIPPTLTPTPVIIAGAVVSPTPTAYTLNYCNKSCSSDTDCPTGLNCMGGNIFGTGKTCLNRYCEESLSCVCGDGLIPGSLNLISPAPEPGLTGGNLLAIPLSVKSFTNNSGQSNDRPVISGMTEPGAKVTISVVTDGVSGEVVADTKGRWSWQPEKPLTAGEKSLLVVARSTNGQGQVNQTFTVVAGRSFPWGWIILVLVLIAVGFGGYVYYKSM